MTKETLMPNAQCCLLARAALCRRALAIWDLALVILSPVLRRPRDRRRIKGTASPLGPALSPLRERLTTTPHPGGMVDNSPTFQRWVRRPQWIKVPKGRLKMCARSAVPSGLIAHRRAVPNVETLGYYRKSLRDRDLRAVCERLEGSIPSGIGTQQRNKKRDAEFFGAVEHSGVAADWKVRAPL